MESVRKNRDLIDPESVKLKMIEKRYNQSVSQNVFNLQRSLSSNSIPPPPKTAHKTLNIKLHQLDILFINRSYSGTPNDCFL